MNEVQHITELAKGISDYGFMVIVCAIFLLLSAGLMIACFKWFKSAIEDILSYTDELRELNGKLEHSNHTMECIAEGLTAENQLRIKNISGVYFDLATEKVCRLIKKIREENHIANREATRQKIHTLLTNRYEDRNTRFDSFKYNGKKLSEYCNPVWIDWVAQVVENELYNEAGENNGRAYTNISAIYENIKLDFYHRMND